MTFTQFEKSLKELSDEEFEKVFHQVYDTYLFASQAIGDKKLARGDYFKIMAQLKKSERLISIMLNE